MVSLYTQYRKQYKGPRWDDFAISEYNRKRDYRIGRRSVEHQHQPWEWGSSVDSSDSENSDAEPNRQISEKKNDVLQYREENSKKNGCDGRLAGASKIGKPFTKSAWVSEQDDVNTDEHVNQKATQTTHRKRRKSKSKRKKAVKKEVELERKKFVNSRERQHERVPFVSYGWANDAPVEKKFTHNVRASPKDVYPASLRALKRRELDIRKRLEENKRKTLLEHEKIEEKFFNLSHTSPLFMTEYQRSYCNMDSEKTGYVW